MPASRTLPEHGESSFNLVLKGTDLKQFNKRYPRKIKRRTPITTPKHLMQIGCFSRYLTYREFSPVQNLRSVGLISPNIEIRYTVYVNKQPFASFTDITEALLCRNSMSRYGTKKSEVYPV